MMRALRSLPTGRTLPDDAWAARHRAMVLLLWAHAVGIPLFALARDYSPLHAAAEGGAVAAFALTARWCRSNRKLGSGIVSLGLLTCSALIVHVSGGVIEAHFHFFVMISVLALYEDWLPFGMAAAYVIFHHALLTGLDAGAVFNHRDALEHPWKWAGIHGAFIAANGVAAVVAWRLNEDVRARAMRASAEKALAEQGLATAQSELRRRQELTRRAAELNDDVVQGLVVAKYAADRGARDEAARLLDKALDDTRRIVTDLIASAGVEGQGPQPGDLRRTRTERATSG